jgi:hypothetical protein
MSTPKTDNEELIELINSQNNKSSMQITIYVGATLANQLEVALKPHKKKKK